MYTIMTRQRRLVNTDPQRRCYYGVHAKSELRWGGWERLVVGLETLEDAEAKAEWWRDLNQYAVDARGEEARREFKVVNDNAGHDDNSLQVIVETEVAG